MFDFLKPLQAGYTPKRSTRQHDRYGDTCRRLCASRQDVAEHAGGVPVQPGPSRTPRRSASRKPASDGGTSDGEPEPARRNVAPIFYNLADVADALSLSTRGVQRMVQSGEFPKPRALTSRRVAWLVRDVEAWAESREVADMLPPTNCGQRNAMQA